MDRSDPVFLNASAKRAGCDAFTSWDLVVLLGTVALLLFLLLPTLDKRRRVMGPVNCISNLKQIGLAFHLWSTDHEEKFPMALSALGAHGGTKEFNFTGQVWRHFQILAQELPNPKVLACPSDRRRQCRDWKDFTDNRHLSYLVGLDADESKSQMILSGDRNLTSTLRATKSASNGVLALGLGDRVEWTQAVHNRAGNIALADGSAFRVTDYCLNKQLRAALATSSQETHRLALPE